MRIAFSSHLQIFIHQQVTGLVLKTPKHKYNEKRRAEALMNSMCSFAPLAVGDCFFLFDMYVEMYHFYPPA